MKKKSLLPSSPVQSVRADTSIEACVRILRDQSIGALLITSDDSHEELVGIFTERDLVKHIEIIQHGDFWNRSVRTVMTSNIRTISIDKLNEAPKLMAKHHIRHLPIVDTVKGKQKILGVLSMRDLFRLTMEEIDFDLEAFFDKPQTRKSSKPITMGIISKDKNLHELTEHSVGVNQNITLKKTTVDSPLLGTPTLGALMLDIDGMTDHDWAEAVKKILSKKKDILILLAFNPVGMADKTRSYLHSLSDSKQITLLSKPVALGRLYEILLKDI